MSYEYKINKNSLNYKQNKKFDINSHNNQITTLLKLNMERQSDILAIRTQLDRAKKIKWDYNSISNFMMRYDSLEDERILQENQVLEQFANVFYTQDVHMKNIDKICRKITKMQINDKNEISVVSQVSAAHHLQLVMDGEPLKQLSVREKLNISEMVNSQITNLITDYQVDVHLLISIVCDYVRKVFSIEFLRYFLALEEAILQDQVPPLDVRSIASLQVALKTKFTNNLQLFRSINKSQIHLDPKVEKMHKFLIDSNMKTKSSLNKQGTEFDRRNTNEDIVLKKPINKISFKNKDNRKMPKVMNMRLDYNNKIEISTIHHHHHNKRNTENVSKKPSINEEKEILKRFQIEEFTCYLDHIKQIINSILIGCNWNIKNQRRISLSQIDSTETSILNDLTENNNELNDIFKYLEKGWRREKLSKICFKIRIVSRVRYLQRFWRQQKYNKQNAFAKKIQTFFKKVVVKRHLNRMNMIQKLQNVRKSQNKLKIRNSLRLYVKKFRINKVQDIFTQEKKAELLTYYSLYKDKIIQIQKMARSQIGWRTVIKLRQIQHDELISKKLKRFRNSYKNQQKSNQFFESTYLGREILCKWELWKLEDQIEQQLEVQDHGWDEQEGRLREQLNKHVEMKDWIQQTNSLGVRQWINIKTLKDQREHPSLKVFRTNKKLLKDKADQEMGFHMQPQTSFKDVLEDFSDNNFKEQACVLADNKSNFLKNFL